MYKLIRRWQEQLRGTGGSNTAKEARPELDEI